MDLDAYLARIGHDGPLRADRATLGAMVTAHLDVVPFENLDVRAGVPVGLAPEAAYEKIVAHRRGGWCYELNGLFGWALEQVGFEVRRLSGAVLREKFGDRQRDTHLCLMVTADEPYLVDVGFGGSLAAPLPLLEGERSDPPFTVGLARI